jgi:hypothetical protein
MALSSAFLIGENLFCEKDISADQRPRSPAIVRLSDCQIRNARMRFTCFPPWLVNIRAFLHDRISRSRL